MFTLGGPTWINDGLATLAAPGTAQLTYLRPSGHTSLEGTGTLRLLDADHSVVDSPGGWEFTQAACGKDRNNRTKPLLALPCTFPNKAAVEPTQ